MSSVSDVRGIGAHVTLRPAFRNGRITLCQQEPSAHAPWTNTIVEFGAKELIMTPRSPRGTLSCGRNFDDMRLYRKMAGIQELDSRSRHVAAGMPRPPREERMDRFFPKSRGMAAALSGSNLETRDRASRSRRNPEIDRAVCLCCLGVREEPRRVCMIQAERYPAG